MSCPEEEKKVTFNLSDMLHLQPFTQYCYGHYGMIGGEIVKLQTKNGEWKTCAET
jgi:hypothetical protein